MEITDSYTLIMLLSVLTVIYLLGNKALSSKTKSNPRDKSYEEAMKIKSETIEDLKSRLRTATQRIYNMSNGAKKDVGKLPEDAEDMVDSEIAELYDKYVPAGIKDLVPFEAAKDWLEKNPDEIKKVVGRFKKEGANGRFDLGASDSI